MLEGLCKDASIESNGLSLEHQRDAQKVVQSAWEALLRSRGEVEVPINTK